MKNDNDSIQALRSFLKTLSTDDLRLTGDSRSKVIGFLMECWPFLNGSSEHSTFSDKLYRAENLRWESPILDFQLERHGATVNGSRRADIHYWEVNIEEGSAKIVKNGRRQLEKMAPRMDTKAKAIEIAEIILNGQDHPSLSWDNNRDYVVISIGLIIPETIPQTTQSRRKRFRDDLEKTLSAVGCGEERTASFESFTCRYVRQINTITPVFGINP